MYSVKCLSDLVVYFQNFYQIGILFLVTFIKSVEGLLYLPCTFQSFLQVSPNFVDLHQLFVLDSCCEVN